MMVHTSWFEWVIIFFILCLAAILSFKRSWLTFWGGMAMILMGTLIDLAFGLRGLFVIFIFFISSNLIEKWMKKGLPSTPSQPRTAIQVFANGGIPLISGVFVILDGSFLFGLGSFLASLAGATADTWASEVGTLKAREPYHVALRQQVAPGLSGAVTSLGSFAGGLGAVCIAVASAILMPHQPIGQKITFCILIIIAGWGGQWLDTFLGAYFQARYQCHTCGVLTDASIHCGQPTTLVHGYTWMTNNLVNACSSTLTGCLGGLFFLLFLEGKYIVF